MRFAYIDSQGKEVGIPTVDALRLRIALRAIVEDTTFFDASTGRWAPAAEHEVFRSLRKELEEQEEGGFVAPPPPSHTVADEDSELEVEGPADEVDEAQEDDDQYHFSISNAPSDEPSDLPVEGPDDALSDGPGEATDDAFGDAFDDVPGDATDGSFGDITDTPADADALAAPVQGAPGDSLPEAVTGEDPDEPEVPARPEEDDGDPVFDLNEAELVEPEKEQQESGPLRITPELEALPASGQPNAGGVEGATDGSDAVDAPGSPGGLGPEDETEPGDGPAVEGPGDESHRLEGFSADRVEFEGMVESAGWGDEPAPDEPEVLSSADELMGRGGGGDDDEGFGGALELETDDSPPARAEEQPSRLGPRPPSAPDGGSDEELPIPTREDVRRKAQMPAGDGSRGPSGSAPPPRLRRTRSGGGALVAIVVVLAVVGGGGWWFFTSRGGATAEAEAPASTPSVAIPDIPAELEPRMREIAEGAHAETMTRLGEVAAAADLPEEPDTEWLAGSYMANASSYQGVQTYWEAMDRFLRRLQAAQDSIFALALAARIDASGLAGEDARLVSERIEAGYRAASLDRAETYRQARQVPETALRLHGFLVENEPSISHEPAAGGLSRDPVLEAVPDTPEIGEEMWDRVGEITASMDALGFLDRITTPRFLEAVLARVGAVEIR